MHVHSDFDLFWTGGTPRTIPVSIYRWLWEQHADDPAWGELFDRGLKVASHIVPYRVERPVEIRSEQTGAGNALRCFDRWVTPYGELREVHYNGWNAEYLLKTEEDYRIMADVVRNTRLSPARDEFAETEARFGDTGISLVFIGRTPLQTMLVDLAGLEQFCLHLCLFPDTVGRLYEELLKEFTTRVDIASEAPGRYVALIENFSAETLGPRRFDRYIRPVYDSLIPRLHAAGKSVGVHYDGKTACVADSVAASPVDIIESLTEPPEGDQTLAQCRSVWPEKNFWVNVNVDNYSLPPEQLRARIRHLYRTGARSDGSGIAFEISEELPANWRRSVPVLLDTVEEL